MKKEEFISQSGESLTVIGGRGPLEQALSNLSSKQGYLQGLLRAVSSQMLNISKDIFCFIRLLRLHLEQEGGSSLLYKVHPENKRQRNS